MYFRLFPKKSECCSLLEVMHFSFSFHFISFDYSNISARSITRNTMKMKSQHCTQWQSWVTHVLYALKKTPTLYQHNFH